MFSVRQQWTWGHFKMLMFGYIQFVYSFCINASERIRIRQSFTGFKFGHNLRQKTKPPLQKALSWELSSCNWSGCPIFWVMLPASWPVLRHLSHRRPSSEVHLPPTATKLNCITNPLMVLAVVNRFLKQYKTQFPCYQPACWVQRERLQIKQFPPTQRDYYSIVRREYCSSKYKAASSSPVFISESLQLSGKMGIKQINYSYRLSIKQF